MVFSNIEEVNDHLNLLGEQHKEHYHYLQRKAGDTTVEEKNGDCLITVAIADAVKQLMAFDFGEIKRMKLSDDNHVLEKFIYDSIAGNCDLEFSYSDTVFTVKDSITEDVVLSVSSSGTMMFMDISETKVSANRSTVNDEKYESIREKIYVRYGAVLPRREFLFT